MAYIPGWSLKLKRKDELIGRVQNGNVDNWQEDEAGKNKILNSIKLRAWGRREVATGCRARSRRPKLEGHHFWKRPCSALRLSNSESGVSAREKRFWQELEGRLVMGVDVVRKENRAHGHTHQEEQTSLASKACQSPEYVNGIQTKIFPSHQMHNFA